LIPVKPPHSIVKDHDIRPGIHFGKPIKIKSESWSEPFQNKKLFIQLPEQQQLWLLTRVGPVYEIKKMNLNENRNEHSIIITLSQIQAQVTEYHARMEWLRLQRLVFSQEKINALPSDDKDSNRNFIVGIHLGESLDLKNHFQTIDQELKNLNQALNDICTAAGS
jgi:hypothetical protein